MQEIVIAAVIPVITDHSKAIAAAEEVTEDRGVLVRQFQNRMFRWILTHTE